MFRSLPSLTLIIREERLDPAATHRFVAQALRDGQVSRQGTAIVALLPPLSRFTPDGRYHLTKQRVLDRLTAWVDRELAWSRIERGAR